VTRAFPALALVLAAASPAWAALYRWVDAAGVIHYTSEADTIPPAFRSSAQALDHPSGREPEPSVSAAPGAVVPVEAGAPVVVEAYLNGVALRLLVDTGAERTVISPDSLARAGIDPERGVAVRITGVTGSSPAWLVGIQRLDVAGAQIGPLAVIAHTIPADGLDGLLGRDVLDAFTVTFQAAENRAVLTPR
jgi:hypothetical protein